MRELTSEMNLTVSRVDSISFDALAGKDEETPTPAGLSRILWEIVPERACTLPTGNHQGPIQ